MLYFHYYPTSAPPQKPDTRALPLHFFINFIISLFHFLPSTSLLRRKEQNDHCNRLLPRHDRNAATLRGHDTRLWFREMVENLLPGPMLRHKPFRCSIRRPFTLLPLHRVQQPLRDELPVHRCGHAAEDHRAGGADHLEQREQEGAFGMGHNAVLNLHPPQHAGDGYSVAEGDVRGVLREFDGADSGAPVHHLVHLDAVHVRVQRRQNVDL